MCAVFQLGDRVVYGIHGVCCIVDTEIRSINRKKVEYFVLEPREQPGARYYIPTQNPAALSKLQPLLNKEQLDALLNSDEVRKDIWVSDENHRKQHYRELINSGDRAALISMVRSLHRHKEAQAAAGRKFHLCDENFLRDAEKLLTSEFALILDVDYAQAVAYIKEALEK